MKKEGVAFIFVPKTGGTFLTSWNINIFPNQKKPSEQLSQRMLHIPVSRMADYVDLSKTKLFTIVRDPYDQACSEYFDIKRRGDLAFEYLGLNRENPKSVDFIAKRAADIIGNPFFRDHINKVYLNNFSIDEYLEQRSYNCVYSYYYDFKKPKDFDCVGITEEMDKTIRLAEKILNINLGDGPNHENKNKKINQKYNFDYSRKDFEKNNQIDYELYYQGKEKFKKLCLENKIS